MDSSDLSGMAEYQLIGDTFGYHSGYGSATGQPPGPGQAGQAQAVPSGSVLTGLPGQGSSGGGAAAAAAAQAYHQLQSQHASRAPTYPPQSSDPLMSHKIHSQYAGYGSAGSGVPPGLGVRGQYPTDPRYGHQHGMADYGPGLSQSHLSSLQAGAPAQPPMPSAYGQQQNLMGQYGAAGQRMHTPGLTPGRQAPGGPMHGMPSHYSSATYPSGPTQSAYHSHPTPGSDIWSGQGVPPHMQPSSTYPGYPGSGAGGPSGASMHGPRAGQSQYVGHSQYDSALHASEQQQRQQQQQYYSASGGGGPTPPSQSMTAHIPSDGSTSLPYPTQASSQGPYSSGSGSGSGPPAPAQGQSQASSGGRSSGAPTPRQQYMGYTGPSLQAQPTSQQTQPQSSGSSMPRYPHQYSGYPQTAAGYGDPPSSSAAAQSRLSPYPLPSQAGPAGPNSPQFRAGFPSSAGPQLSSLSPRRPTATPPAGSPMPPSSHTPDRSAPNTAAPTSQASSHQSSFPISPGANHLSSPVQGQGMSPGSSVPSQPSSLQQLEQMVMPHLGGPGVGSASKAAIPVSTNTSSAASSTSSYYGSSGAGAAPPSPQSSGAGQRQTQAMYSHYQTSTQSQYPYHQYQQNWPGGHPPMGQSSGASPATTSTTNTHSMGVPLQPQSGGQASGAASHQSSPTVASNSSSPSVSKAPADGPLPVTNSALSGQYNSYGSELNAAVSGSADSNFCQSFAPRSTSSSTNSTPPSTSSSSSSQPSLQTGYSVLQSVSQSTGSSGPAPSFDSSSLMKAQHKQQVQQAVAAAQAQAAAAQADPQQQQQQQSQQQQSQSQSQTGVGAQMSSPTHMFDSIKSPNASTPRPLSVGPNPLANDLQSTQQQSNQSQSEPRLAGSQSVGPTQGGAPPQLMAHHPYHPHHHQHHQLMHQQPGHQPYPPQPQMANYQNSYDPSVGLNYDMSDMSQSSAMSGGPYGDHDSALMYDSYGMDSMVGPPPMGQDYHRESGGDFAPMDPYSANFEDSYGEPPTKRKGKGRPKKDPNEPKKERKPRQPRAPRGSGRGRGRGSKASTLGDRMAPMPPSAMMPPDPYDPNYGLQSDNLDLYGHDMYGQAMPASQQSVAISGQQSQAIPPMPLNSLPAPPHQQHLLPHPHPQQQLQQQHPMGQFAQQQQPAPGPSPVLPPPPPHPPAPPVPQQAPPPSAPGGESSPQTPQNQQNNQNHCQQQMQTLQTHSEAQPPMTSPPISSPVPTPHNFTPPGAPPLSLSPVPTGATAAPTPTPPIPTTTGPMAGASPDEALASPGEQKPLDGHNDQHLYDESFLGQTSVSEANPLNESTIISVPNEDEPSVSLAVPSEGEVYSPAPPRQVSPCPPPPTDDVIPAEAPKLDSYEFSGTEEHLSSTPVKAQKPKKAKKRRAKKEELTDGQADHQELEGGPESEAKPPKPKKAKKRKKKQNNKSNANDNSANGADETQESELKSESQSQASEEANDSSVKASQTATDLDDATQESSQCDSSAIESSAGPKGSAKKSRRGGGGAAGGGDARPKRPKVKNRSPKKKLPKLALKFSKNKKKRRLGSGSPDHSDLERTPPPSPDDTETGIQKRRSARNTKRQKYTDDIDLDLSEEDDKQDGKKGSGALGDGSARPLGEGQVLAVVTNINEDTMVVEKIMSSRMALREIEDETNENNNNNNTTDGTTETDGSAKPQTIEVEEFFVKYKNLSYFHCEWKTEEELEKGDRRMGQKMKRFRQKKDTMNMFDFLDEEPYNPDYVEVDRILDVNEIEEIVELREELKEELKEEQVREEVREELKEELKQDGPQEKSADTKDETESQTNDSQTIETTGTTETDRTEPNSAESSILVPNDSERSETELSDNNELKDKSEESAERNGSSSEGTVVAEAAEKSETNGANEGSTEEMERAVDSANEEKTDDTQPAVDDEAGQEEKEEPKEEPEPEMIASAEQLEPVPAKPVQTTRRVKHYLVKWRALAYEDSTWELEDDLDPIKVEQFYRFRKPPPKSEWKPKKKPKPADWKKIEGSPVYKGDNTLREYQLEGLNWLSFCWYNGQNCILADEMGLGKTIQSLAFVNEICRHGIPGPFLVIAPLSTIGNWQREFETWTDLNVITYHGSSASRNMLQEYEMYYKNDRHERMPGLYKFQVMITTFEIVLTDCLELREIHWRTCIIDEAHRLKNRNCKLLEGLRLLDMEHRVLLTGTPLQNNVEELFSLLNFLEPTQFTSNESFMLEFGDLKTEAQVDKLKAILKPMMLRRLKEDVEKSLAPKEETIVEVELTNIQKKYYRAILERNFQFLSKGGTYANIPNLMNTMMELRKCCIHPFLINGAEEQIMLEYRSQHSGDNEPTVNAIVNASGKLVLIDKLLPRLRANGHRVLVFSQMVRCLDILEDYMVQKRYPYERIDGRVRGNLRQAAIDRFCKPDSDRFVFLLCTRAGGLGINLTAADTVIIFDSDWNPQNDLQAQARCHRIGQSKAVKVYRLICRNTYEREMFDKASLKLGLDRAVLQSMNSSKASLGGADGALSKKEIEDLLRKGAYGALMDDDNAGDKFCEEDIEQILQRRTQKIIIESEGKGSTFSKASFASSSNRSDIEIDDPNFWEKWAKKANFDVDELKGRNELIVQEPRRRTQTKRFGADDAVLDMSELESSDEDDDSVSMRTRGGRNRLPKGKKGKKGRGGGYERERDEDYMQEFGPGNWTRAECYKVEKGLLTFGWGRWAECLLLGNFRRQLTRLDVESISRVLLLFALQHYKGDEKIKAFIWDLITPTQEGGCPIHRNHSGLSAPVPRGRKNKSKKKTVGEELEVSDWAKEDQYSPDVLLTDDMYRKHLHRHANKILLRVRLLYYLKHEIIGELHDQVFAGMTAREIPIPPPVADGDPPAVWWDEEADKSLLVGVYKHGYDRFNLMRQDPALCFLGRCGPPDGAALLAEMNADDDLGKTLDEDDEPETPATPATPLSAESDSTTKSKAEPKEESEPNSAEPAAAAAGALLLFPSPADMNHRLRRVVTSYQRNFKKQEMKLAQRARHLQRLERLERFEAAIKERELKKRDLAQKKWSRREEADFYRVVSSFGVEYQRDEDRYDWTRFRSFGKLERKLDETLTEYFKAFYAMCKRVTGRRLTDEEENLPISVDPISEERASRCLARIDLLSKVREEILTHPELEERLQLCQHSMDLPEWWVSGRHDKDLLVGAAKYGLNRLDFNLVNDPELSFADIFRQMETNDEKKSEIIDEKVDTKDDIKEAKDSESLTESMAEQTEVKPEVDGQVDVSESEDKAEKDEKDRENETKEETTDEKELEREEKCSESDDKKETENTAEECASDETIKSDVKEEAEEVNEKNDEKGTEETEESVGKSESENESEGKSAKTETESEAKVEKDSALKELLDRKIDSETNSKSSPNETNESKEKSVEKEMSCSERTVEEEVDNEKTKEKDGESLAKSESPKAVEQKEEEGEREVTEPDLKTETEEKEEQEEQELKAEEKESDEKMECDAQQKEEVLEELPKKETDDQSVKSEPTDEEKRPVSTEEATIETTEKESPELKAESELKTESETASVATEKEVSVTSASTPQPQSCQQKSCLRFPKDRVLQMRLEQICHTVEKNEWPSLRHSLFSLISGPHPSTPSVATADSSPRPLSPCSLSSASREPTPHPTPDHTPRREALSPLPEFFYADNSVSALNESASRRRRRRRRRFEVEAERAKLRNLLSQTIEQQQQMSQSSSMASMASMSTSASKKQSSLLSGTAPQFLPPLFSLPFCNLRSAIRDELMTDEKTASLLLGSTLQSSLAAAAASAQQSASSAREQTGGAGSGASSAGSSKGPPPAHQNSSVRNTANSMGTLDLTGRFKSTPKTATPPAPAHKPAPTKAESRTPAAAAGQDVLDLSSVPTKRSTREHSSSSSSSVSAAAKRLAAAAAAAAAAAETNSSASAAAQPLLASTSKKSSRRIGSRIDALALNLQAKKMMEEKQIDLKSDKPEPTLSLEKRQAAAAYLVDELSKHSALLHNQKTPPMAHSKSSSSSTTTSSKLNDSLLKNTSNAHFGSSLDTSKLPPSKATEASTIAEQVAIIRQNLRNLFEDHPEFIAQNPSMASMVAASAANVFNPNLNMSSMSSLPANTELLELPDSRRGRSRRSRVDPSQLDMQRLTGEENVSVINRTTGKKITGSKAPPLKHLAEWLDKNPKFDVDPKWSPLVSKEKAATFKTPTSVSNMGVRTRTSDKRSSSSASSLSASAAANLLNHNSLGSTLGSNSNSTSSSSSSSRRSTAASLLASGYGNAFGGTAVTSSGLNPYTSSAALNSLSASMLAGFPSMKMFMDPTSGAAATTTTASSKSNSASATSSSATTTTSSSSGAPPLFFPFGGLAGMGLANPLFGFPSFNLPGLTPTSSAGMSGTGYLSDKKDSSEGSASTESRSKSSGKSSGGSGKSKGALNSSTSAASLLGSGAAASALGSGALPFLYPSPNFLYNPLSLSGFSGLSGSPFGLPGLMNGLGSLSTTAMSGFTATNTFTNTNSGQSSRSKTTANAKSSKTGHSASPSASLSSAPSGLSLASSLLASAGVHPSSAAAAAAIGDSDDDSLKSLMGNDFDDDLNGDYDDKDMDGSDGESEARSTAHNNKKKSSSNKCSAKEVPKSRTKGNSTSTSKV